MTLPGTRTPAIDSLVNSSFLNANGEGGLAYLFKDLAERPRIETAEQLLQQMGEAGVGAAVLSIMEPGHAEWVGKAHQQFPDRILPAMIVDPTKGMDEVRKVVRYYDEHGVRCLRIPPFRYTLPPTDRAYWPFYVKAIELDIPVSMNSGMPGPRRPGWVQNPMFFDEVAFNFPELRLVMTHCGQPWTGEAISVMSHWDNVFMSATSVAPRYWTAEFVRFINTRGRKKMLYGTEYPTIPWMSSRDDIDAHSLREDVREDFFRENARRVFKWDALGGAALGFPGRGR